MSEKRGYPYDWTDYEEWKDVVREYVAGESQVAGSLFEQQRPALDRINNKLRQLILPWAKTRFPRGTWTEMTDMMRKIILSDIVGSDSVIESSKELGAEWRILDGMLGQGYNPDLVVGKLITDKFGITVEEAT